MKLNGEEYNPDVEESVSNKLNLDKKRSDDNIEEVDNKHSKKSRKLDKKQNDKVDITKYSNLEEKLQRKDVKLKMLLSILSCIITIVAFVAFIVCIFKSNNIVKKLNNNYSEELRNSTLYVYTEIETANINYYDGVSYITNLGNIIGPSAYRYNKIIYVYRDINNQLKIFDNSINTEYYSYVTQGYSIPEGGLLITSDNEKEEVLNYIEDASNLKNINANKELYKVISLIMLVMSLIFIALTLVANNGKLGFTDDLNKDSYIEDNKPKDIEENQGE